MSLDLDFKTAEYTLKFGNFILDLDTQTLITEESSIRLRSKLCQVLEFLVKNKNRLISREELIEQIWKGNNYTGQQAVTHSICHLRKLLSSLGNGSALIDTIPKKGYRLHVAENKLENSSQTISFSQNKQNITFLKTSSFSYGSENSHHQEFIIDFL